MDPAHSFESGTADFTEIRVDGILGDVLADLEPSTEKLYTDVLLTRCENSTSACSWLT